MVKPPVQLNEYIILKEIYIFNYILEHVKNVDMYTL